MMRKRKTFNPKRRLCPKQRFAERLEFIRGLARRTRYNGNPEHKRTSGDFGLDPPSLARPGKTLCDDVNIRSRAEALELLRAGLMKGLISVQERGDWPQNVWAVTSDGQPVEAQLEGDGAYHGYPMPMNDPLREDVLTRWNES